VFLSKKNKKKHTTNVYNNDVAERTWTWNRCQRSVHRMWVRGMSLPKRMNSLVAVFSIIGISC